MLRKQILFILAAFSVTACAHQVTVAKPTPSPEPAPAVAVAAPVPSPVVPPGQSCSTDLACSSNQLCVSGACTDISPTLAACGLTRVHFDFDADVLHADEYPKLRRMERCIQANQPAHVLITGNADERGTVEYNLALGQRRAAAVQKYLTDLGVPVSRLQLVSYGKELPVCSDHDEACWQRNRRSGIRPGETPQDIVAREKADAGREQASLKK